MASFTNIGLDTYILLFKYSYTFVAFHLMIFSTPRFESSAVIIDRHVKDIKDVNKSVP